jgi:hypothetical protein
VQLLQVGSLRCCNKRLQVQVLQRGLAVVQLVGSSQKNSSGGAQGSSSDVAPCL